MHDGCVYHGLRYSAYLRGVLPDAYVVLIRNDCANPGEKWDDGFESIKSRVPLKIFGITVGYTARNLTETVEFAISRVREYDAVLETFEAEEEGEEQ